MDFLRNMKWTVASDVASSATAGAAAAGCAVAASFAA